MTAGAKQIIYVDVDDEITTVIDKVNSADAKVVALVLPKRATIFQSVVNMKLLKRRAEAAKKHIVLVTSEAGLMPLAGLAGVHVAPTPQSKPEIPALAGAAHNEDADDDALDDTDFNAAQNAAAPIGSLAAPSAAGSVAGLGVVGQKPLTGDDDEVIELDNTAKKPALTDRQAASAGTGADPKKAANRKATKDKKLKIPNFFSFRKRLLLLGVGLVVLVAGWYVAYFILPKATITIVTDSSDVNTQLSLTLDTAASTASQDKLVLPAETKQEQKSATGQAPASGQQNKGAIAAGSLRMTASRCAPDISQPSDIPAGTGVTANGNTYLTQEAASFSFNGASGSCVNYQSGVIDITAQKGGQAYNTSGSVDFTVSSTIKGSGSASGGTDNIVKVVQQSDVDAAKQKLAASQDQTAIKKQLQQRLQDDSLYALEATFSAGTPNDNLSSKVGDEADSVTVTEAVTYTMFGVKKDDFKSLINASLEKKINTAQQSILNDGLDKARLTVGQPGAGPQLKLDAYVTALAGPKIDTAQLKTELVGMKSGNVKDRIKRIQDVEDVQVKFTPFWVSKVPKADKVTIQFEKAASTGANNGN